MLIQRKRCGNIITVIKMRKKMLNTKGLSPSCSYCEYGKASVDGETVLCRKKGVVEKDFACKKFKYDILKRQPKRPKPLEKFNPEDFSL